MASTDIQRRLIMEYSYEVNISFVLSTIRAKLLLLTDQTHPSHLINKPDGVVWFALFCAVIGQQEMQQMGLLCSVVDSGCLPVSQWGPGEELWWLHRFFLKVWCSTCQWLWKQSHTQDPSLDSSYNLGRSALIFVVLKSLVTVNSLSGFWRSLCEVQTPCC